MWRIYIALKKVVSKSVKSSCRVESRTSAFCHVGEEREVQTWLRKPVYAEKKEE